MNIRMDINIHDIVHLIRELSRVISKDARKSARESWKLWAPRIVSLSSKTSSAKEVKELLKELDEIEDEDGKNAGNYIWKICVLWISSCIFIILYRYLKPICIATTCVRHQGWKVEGWSWQTHCISSSKVLSPPPSLPLPFPPFSLCLSSFIVILIICIKFYIP